MSEIAEYFNASLKERCPYCQLNWQLFPPARINKRIPGTNKSKKGPLVRCVECKNIYNCPVIIEAWTDYPFVEFGDSAGKIAPIRKVTPVSYDGDKYVTVEFAGKNLEVKAEYLYSVRGYYGSPLFNINLIICE